MKAGASLLCGHGEEKEQNQLPKVETGQDHMTADKGVTAILPPRVDSSHGCLSANRATSETQKEQTLFSSKSNVVSYHSCAYKSTVGLHSQLASNLGIQKSGIWDETNKQNRTYHTAKRFCPQYRQGLKSRTTICLLPL